jgi:hypothetical protein
MSKIDHARILHAYLARMTLSDMENIFNANKEWTHAALNYGNNAQDKARAKFYAALANAVNNLMKHDIGTIEQVINEECERVTL